MGFDILLKFWREALILALLVAFAASSNYALEKRDELVLKEHDWQGERERAAAAEAEQRAKYAKTNEELSDAIPGMVAAAQSEFAENYKRKYGAAATRGCGMRLERLPNADTVPEAGGRLTDSTSPNDEESAGVLVTKEFGDATSEAAVILDMWIKLARKDGFKIQGE